MPKTIQIVKEPNRVLRKIAENVSVKDITSSKIQKLILAMKETLKHTPLGVGLAAPQIGESLRIFLVSEEAEEIDHAEKKGWRRRRKENPSEKNPEPYETRDWRHYVFINPLVKNISKKKIEDSEGCLSVPEKYGTVKRHEKLTVEAHDETGKKFTRGASNFFARVLQHELDHLNGTLFIDKATKFFEPIREGKR